MCSFADWSGKQQWWKEQQTKNGSLLNYFLSRFTPCLYCSAKLNSWKAAKNVAYICARRLRCYVILLCLTVKYIFLPTIFIILTWNICLESRFFIIQKCRNVFFLWLCGKEKVNLFFPFFQHCYVECFPSHATPKKNYY